MYTFLACIFPVGVPGAALLCRADHHAKSFTQLVFFSFFFEILCVRFFRLPRLIAGCVMLRKGVRTLPLVPLPHSVGRRAKRFFKQGKRKGKERWRRVLAFGLECLVAVLSSSDFDSGPHCHYGAAHSGLEKSAPATLESSSRSEEGK